MSPQSHRALRAGCGVQRQRALRSTFVTTKPICVSTHPDTIVSVPPAVPLLQQQSQVQEAEEEGERVLEGYFFFQASCCNTPWQGTSLAALPTLPLAH